MRKLIALGVVVAILGVGDFLAKAYVESGVERSIRAEVQGVGGLDASISSFPFVGRVLFAGEVSHARVTLTDVSGRGIPVSALRLQIDGLRFDRNTLLNRSQLRIIGVDSVEFLAVLSRDDLAAVLGPAAAALELVEGTTLAVNGGQVELPGGLRIAVPSTELLPCDPTATVGDQEVVLSCTSDTLPAIVVQAIGSIDLRDQLGL